jgi:hypothetical protein
VHLTVNAKLKTNDDKTSVNIFVHASKEVHGFSVDITMADNIVNGFLPANTWNEPKVIGSLSIGRPSLWQFICFESLVFGCGNL